MSAVPVSPHQDDWIAELRQRTHDLSESVQVSSFERRLLQQAVTDGFKQVHESNTAILEKLKEMNGTQRAHGEAIAVLKDRGNRPGKVGAAGGLTAGGVIVGLVEACKWYFGAGGK